MLLGYVHLLQPAQSSEIMIVSGYRMSSLVSENIVIATLSLHCTGLSQIVHHLALLFPWSLAFTPALSWQLFQFTIAIILTPLAPLCAIVGCYLLFWVNGVYRFQMWVHRRAFYYPISPSLPSLSILSAIHYFSLVLHRITLFPLFDPILLLDLHEQKELVAQLAHLHIMWE